ncbi:MAG TPA: sugar phosphate isomerase/epimerase family protein [Phycisphaerae bacterium]|nr:sugar phosphate isomerase/epimerase family protein [Phycisphaerae bacterium]
MSNAPSVPAALSIEGLPTADARASFDLAAASGYQGIAFATNHPELNPDALGASARRHVKTILSTKHLGIDSVRAAAPRGGLADAATIDRTLDQARKAMLLARELGVRTVSLNVGRLPDERGSGGGIPESTLVAAVRELAQHADASGLTLALSADELEPLTRILKAVDFDRARIDFDTARSLGAGGDVLLDLDRAAGRIGQLTAADAIRAGRNLRAAALGEGQLPLQELVERLREQDFTGPWVVSVRDLPDAAGGAARAAEIMRRYLSSLK